jgi:hypothetical protein
MLVTVAAMAFAAKTKRVRATSLTADLDRCEINLS